MRSHDKKTFANEYCICRGIPHRWGTDIVGQLIIGTNVTGTDCVYSIYNIPYSDIVKTIDDMCEYNDFGQFIKLKKSYF